MNQRIVVWFSCGAASANAAKLITEQYKENVEIVYCNTLASEHPNNFDFLKSIEQWTQHHIRIISSDIYKSIDDVFEQTRYMAGIAGARCTIEMKKRPRFAFQRPDDIHVFGMTYDERHRIDRFENNNPELNLKWILRDERVTKNDCYKRLKAANIELPMMYQLGYKNNNCIGCVKATGIGYWSKIRDDFPEIFAKRVQQSRALNVRLCKIKGQRAFLDEIPPSISKQEKEEHENISCGPECGGEVTSWDESALLSSLKMED